MAIHIRSSSSFRPSGSQQQCNSGSQQQYNSISQQQYNSGVQQQYNRNPINSGVQQQQSDQIMNILNAILEKHSKFRRATNS
jgi:hypothetical protein